MSSDGRIDRDLCSFGVVRRVVTQIPYSQPVFRLSLSQVPSLGPIQ